MKILLIVWVAMGLGSFAHADSSIQFTKPYTVFGVCGDIKVEPVSAFMQQPWVLWPTPDGMMPTPKKARQFYGPGNITFAELCRRFQEMIDCPSKVGKFTLTSWDLNGPTVTEVGVTDFQCVTQN